MRSRAELARIRPERPRGRGSRVAQGRLRCCYLQLEARSSTKSESSESARPGWTCGPEARVFFTVPGPGPAARRTQRFKLIFKARLDQDTGRFWAATLGTGVSHLPVLFLRSYRTHYCELHNMSLLPTTVQHGNSAFRDTFTLYARSAEASVIPQNSGALVTVLS